METPRFRLTRDVSVNECEWLHRNFKEGEIVFEYPLYISSYMNNKGIICSEKDSESPFFELQKDALKKVNPGDV